MKEPANQRSSVTRGLRLVASPSAEAESTARREQAAYELALALRDREPRAAAQAWDRYALMVRGLLCKTLGTTPELDDLLQEVFLTLWKRAPTLRDPSALQSFITGITVRVAHGELRRQRIKRWLSFRGEELPEVFADDVDYEARQALARLYGVLDKLGPEARMVFLLRHAQGLELTEIATALDISLAGVKRKLSKAQQRVLLFARNDAALMGLLQQEAP